MERWQGRVGGNRGSDGSKGLGWGPGGACSGASGDSGYSGHGSNHYPPALWAPEGVVIVLQESVVLCHWTLSYTAPVVTDHSLVTLSS